MRTARYRIQIDDTRQWHSLRSDRSRKSQWSRFVDTCKALAKDGFEYAVSITRDGDIIRLMIKGTAGHSVAVRKPVRRAFTLPAKVTPDRCAKMAAEARAMALRGGMIVRRQRMAAWEYGASKRAEDKRIGNLIARAKARGESIIHDDGIAWGVAATIAARRQRSYPHFPASDDAAASIRQHRLAALADYKHWREMELLSGQRQQFKPGLSDENFYADDEVAA